MSLSPVKAALKIAAFGLWSLMAVPPQLIVLAFHKGQYAHIIPRFWHKGVCAIFGIRYEIEGVPETRGQTLYMFNHLSYLDIPVIGGILKYSSFLAKKDVQSWGLFAFLANLQRTAYIDRSRMAIKEESAKLQKRVSEEQNLVLFPEGTSTDGFEVKKFKPPLFALALEKPDLLVQPVTLCLVTVDGKKPEAIEERRKYTWPVEDPIEMPAHLWRFAHTNGATLKITFHDSLKASEYEDRKTLAKACQIQVSKGLESQKVKPNS